MIIPNISKKEILDGTAAQQNLKYTPAISQTMEALKEIFIPCRWKYHGKKGQNLFFSNSRTIIIYLTMRKLHSEI